MSRKRFIVIGLGNFGASVAATLHELGHEVVAMDRDPERVDGIGRTVSRGAVGDGTDVQVLRRLGAENADAAIISTGADITASALSTLVMRDLGVQEVYVKVVSSEHARLIEKIGVTETIFPERESGIRLGRRVSNRLLLNYIPLGSGFSLQEMAVPNAWVGHTLRELELPRRHGIILVALHDILRDEMVPVPDPDGALKESDTLLVAGTDESLMKAGKMERS
jgi:trk system potassium uptake protein